LVEAAGRVSPFTRTYLLEAHPISFNKGLFTIGFDPEFEDHIGLVDNARNHNLLQTKLAELGHVNAQIKFVRAEAPAGWQRPQQPPVTPMPPPPAKAANVAKPAQTLPVKDKPEKIPSKKEDFKNDPLIQKALEMFKGQIVEVRS